MNSLRIGLIALALVTISGSSAVPRGKLVVPDAREDIVVPISLRKPCVTKAEIKASPLFRKTWKTEADVEPAVLYLHSKAFCAEAKRAAAVGIMDDFNRK